MPKGPQGQKRPADSIGLAVLIGKIATGEVEDDADESKALPREGGKKGRAGRDEAESVEEASAVARKAAKSRAK